MFQGTTSDEVSTFISGAQSISKLTKSRSFGGRSRSLSSGSGRLQIAGLGLNRPFL